MRPSRPVLALFAAVAVQGCGSPSPAAPQKPGAPAASPAGAPGAKAPAVLATVNGVAITEVEVGLAKGAHAAGGSPDDQKRAALEALVREELIRQRAVSLGLDQDPLYLEDVRKAEAQLVGVKRKLLGELWSKREVEAAAEVTDADARAFFAANEQQFRTEYHVQQIMLRDAGKAAEIKAELKSGTPFATIAARQFPTLPEGATPWDLGFLGYAQLPEAWKSVVSTLKPGETSDILPGNRNRFWIVQLVEVRPNPKVEVEKIVPVLKASLKSAKLDEARAKAEDGLRASAKIEYPTPLK